MKPMDKAYIESRDIANRYMQGQLCAQECEEFEIYLMENSDVVDKLQIDSIFIKTLPNLSKNPTTGLKLTFWKSLFVTPARASLGTLCGCALVFLFVYQLNYSTLNSKTFTSPSLVYVSATRGNTSQIDANLSLSDLSSTVSLVVQDNFILGKEYQISMLSNSGTDPLHKAVYVPNSDMEIVVLINKDLLQPGLMEIQYSLDSNSKNTKSLVVAVRD